MQQAPFQLGYRRSLDGLRGISILAVMAFHADLVIGGGGFLGVDMFFVLSGFLITALLCEEWGSRGGINLRNFYVRRLLRLLPALVFFLIVQIILVLVRHPADIVLWLRAAGYVVLYVANWALLYNPALIPYNLGHTWSLSIEEQFYLIWPFLLLLLFRRGIAGKSLIRIVGGGILGAALLYLALWSGGSPFTRVYFSLDTRAYALLIGCVTGMMASWGMLPRSAAGIRALRTGSVAAVLLLCVMVVTVVYQKIYPFHLPFLLAAPAMAAIIAGLIAAPLRPLTALLELPPLVWMGRLSYGLYLWHYPIYTFGNSALPRDRYGAFSTIASTVAIILVAAGSYYLVERPFYRLKKKFESGRTTAPAGSKVG
ncbi:MAG: acyltransferase [Chlorobi bacterium]|nr:acyltransferase [Chlorobiota bacterium]